MKLRDWDQLPQDMQNDAVRVYYDILQSKRRYLVIKRLFDVAASASLLVLLSPLFAVTAIAIRIESPGPFMYRQTRKTAYEQDFRIHKFRSMYIGSDRGRLLTMKNDSRVTRVGAFIRKYKIDELGQLIDVLRGDMTFVGVRPQVQKYVNHYTDEMKATFLLPAGITSLASIYYRNENDLLLGHKDPEKLYLTEILPDKMNYNLLGIRKLGLGYELKIFLMTILTVFGKDYKPAKQLYTTAFMPEEPEEEQSSEQVKEPAEVTNG
ncbi:MAG: sugar transferase [Clostridia bacterium]|nr:sugar transferase [Clostridia bacterium]MBR0510511.1 sugar transferase [Clostridia bacterium]MBR0537922.1 sugar transferase [Clostridia bacterium]